jgi:hypothetical protein
MYFLHCRHNWYQSQSHTFIEVFAKGVRKDNLEVDFGEQIVSYSYHTYFLNRILLSYCGGDVFRFPAARCSSVVLVLVSDISKVMDVNRNIYLFSVYESTTGMLNFRLEICCCCSLAWSSILYNQRSLLLCSFAYLARYADGLSSGLYFVQPFFSSWITV